MISGQLKKGSSLSDGVAASKVNVSLGWPVGAFFFTLIMPYTLAFYIGTALITPYRIVIILFFVPIVVQFYRVNHSYRISDYAIFLFSIWTMVCILKNYPGEQRFEKSGQFFLEVPMAFMLGRAYIDTPARFFKFVQMMFVVVAICAVVAVPEAITWRKPIIDITSAITNINPGYYDPGADIRLGMRRAQAFFSNPILFGLFSASIAAMCWYTTRGLLPRIARVAIIGLATFLSLSSAPLLAIISQIGMIILEIASRRLPSRTVVFSSIIVLTVAVLQLATKNGAIGFIINHGTFDPITAYARVIIWDWGLINIQNHPWFGMIPETWVRPSFMDESMDNFYIFSGVLGGIPASVAQVTAIIATLWGVFRIRPERVSELLAGLRMGYLIMMVSIVLAGFSVMFFDKMQPYFYFLLGVGGSMAAYAERNRPRGSHAARPDDAHPRHQLRAA